MRLVGCRFFFPFFGIGTQGLSPRYWSQFPEKDAGVPLVTGTLRKGSPFPVCGTAPSPPTPATPWEGREGPTLGFYLLLNQSVPFLCFLKTNTLPPLSQGSFLMKLPGQVCETWVFR